jgi:hypothetical protein
MARLNQAMPAVSLGIMGDSLTAAKQVAFGDLLVEAGRLQRSHARPDRTLIVDSQDTQSCLAEGHSGLRVH